jgi:hypothetical protein
LPSMRGLELEARLERRRRRARALKTFLFGLFAGFATLIVAALLYGS